MRKFVRVSRVVMTKKGRQFAFELQEKAKEKWQQEVTFFRTSSPIVPVNKADISNFLHITAPASKKICFYYSKDG